MGSPKSKSHWQP